MIRVTLLSVTMLLCQACADMGSLIEVLNARHVESCLYYSGSIGPYGQIRGVTATGGASLEECRKHD